MNFCCSHTPYDGFYRFRQLLITIIFLIDISSDGYAERLTEVIMNRSPDIESRSTIKERRKLASASFVESDGNSRRRRHALVTVSRPSKQSEHVSLSASPRYRIILFYESLFRSLMEYEEQRGASIVCLALNPRRLLDASDRVNIGALYYRCKSSGTILFHRLPTPCSNRISHAAVIAPTVRLLSKSDVSEKLIPPSELRFRRSDSIGEIVRA